MTSLDARQPLDWTKAEAYLREKRQQYAAIGTAGIPAMWMFLDPLSARLERGERTDELYDEIMRLE